MSDIAVPPCCSLTDADCAAVQAFEDEVINRLHVLDAGRAREEERVRLSAKRKKLDADAAAPPKPRGTRGASKKKTTTALSKLFES